MGSSLLLGCQTITFRNEPQPRPLPQVLQAVAAAGYDGVELAARSLDLQAPEALGQLLRQHGLRLAALHFPSAALDPERPPEPTLALPLLVEALAALGGRFALVSGTGQGGPERLAALMNEAGRRFAEQGALLCYHNHGRELEADARWLEAFCQAADPGLVGLALDVGWVQRAGVDPVAVIRRFAPRIRYVHLKDVAGEEWRELGRGEVDLPAVLEALLALDLPWWVTEQDRSQQDAAESVAMSAAYLRSWLAGRAGRSA